MAGFIKFDGVDGEIEMNMPSWGLDRIDQLAPDVKQDADPFLVYGEAPEEVIGLGLIYKVDVDAPVDGAIVAPALDPDASGGFVHRLEIVYL